MAVQLDTFHAFNMTTEDFSVYALTAGGSAAIRSAVMPISAETDTSYTFAIGDANAHKQFANSNPVSVIVPPEVDVAFGDGTIIVVEQTDVGVVTIVAGTGVTVNHPPTKTLSLAEQWGMASLIKTGTNTWNASGYFA